jgi:subtilisin family serine protease
VIAQIRKTPGVVWIEGKQPVDLPPPPQPGKINDGAKAVPAQIVRGGYQNLKGKNVIIAIVDSGLDFRHPDFISYDAAGKPTSRLLYLWDTGLNYQTGRGTEAGFKYPNNASIGTVY